MSLKKLISCDACGKEINTITKNYYTCYDTNSADSTKDVDEYAKHYHYLCFEAMKSAYYRSTSHSM